MKRYNNRKEVPDKYKWNLDSWYKSYQEFDQECENIIPRIEALGKYKGKLKNSKKLLEFIKKDIDVFSDIYNLDGYIHLKNDEELGKEENVTRQSKVLNIYTKYVTTVSFYEPELLSFSKKEYEDLFENEELIKYRFALDKIYRQKKHILSEENEIIINRLKNSLDSYDGIASNMLNSENDYGTILVDGEEVVIAQTNLRILLKNKDRNIRKEVYNKFYNKVKEYSGTFASLLNGYCKLNDEIAKIHKYENAWDRKLFNLNFDNKVFETLVSETEKNLDLLQEFYKLKKEALGLKTLEVYDLSMPLIKNPKEYTIEEAEKICLEAVKPLGEDYYKHFKKMFDNRYIDYCQYKGKRSGGYSLNTLTHNSRILMSFIGDLSSISTIIHEGGHNVNHQYIMENNDIIYRSISTMLAEVMSLTNECLLSDYIYKNGKTTEEKLAGLENIMGVIVSNLYGAVREGKIEQDMYKIIESGSSLTKENMNKLVSDSLNKYYGKEVEKEELASLTWATRSHYYMNYYMYAYSICISVACNVAKEIISGNQEMLNNYLKLVKTGGNVWTYDAFKILGIDLEDPKVYQKAFQYFSDLIKEYKELRNN